MYVCVCMRVCVCVCVFVCDMYVCTHEWMRVSMHAQVMTVSSSNSLIMTHKATSMKWGTMQQKI